MPRQIDLSSQNNKVTHNPNVQLKISPDQVTNLMAGVPAALEAASRQIFADFLSKVLALTGLDFSSPEALLISVEKQLSDLFVGIEGDLTDISNWANGVLTATSTAFTELQGEVNDSNTAWNTFLQADWDALTSGDDWSTIVDALQVAWDAFAASVANIQANETLTIKDVLNSLIPGLFPSGSSTPTGLTSVQSDLTTISGAQTTANAAFQSLLNGWWEALTDQDTNDDQTIETWTSAWEAFTGVLAGTQQTQSGAWNDIWDRLLGLNPDGSIKTSALPAAWATVITDIESFLSTGSWADLTHAWDDLNTALWGTGSVGTTVQQSAIPSDIPQSKVTGLPAIQSGFTDLQGSVGDGQQAFATLLSSWQTTVTTPGQSWTDAWASIESAWQTYVTANTKVQTNEWASLSQIVNGMFGFDLTTGLIGQDKVDGLGGSFDQLGAALNGDKADAGDWGWLSDIMTQWFGVSSSAHDMGVTNTNTLGERNNKPLIFGLDDTTESNIAFSPNPDVLSTGYSNKQTVVFVRCQQSDVKNTVAFLASLTASTTASGFYVSVFKVDFANSKLIHQGTSGNLYPQVQPWSTGGNPQWITTSAFGTAVEPGDVIAVLFTAFSGSVALYGLSGKVPVHPTAKLPGMAAYLTTSSIVNTDVSFSSLTFNNVSIPYVGLEISNPPPPSYPDNLNTFTSSATHPIATWLTTGDKVDLVGIGGGGGGQGEMGASVGVGGDAGAWNGRTLTVGATGASGIKAGSSITISVPGQSGRAGYVTSGYVNGPTTFTWEDASNATQTLTCSGGKGGGIAAAGGSYGLGGGSQVISNGESAGNYTFNSKPYSGGSGGLGGAPGNSPGGGGGGAPPFQFGYQGARGQAWTVERQA